MDAIYAELEAEGRATLAEAGVAAEEIVFTRKADLRHVGQGHEIVVTLPYERVTGVNIDLALRPLFYEAYAEIYGYAHERLGLEIATCRLTAAGQNPTWSSRKTKRPAPPPILQSKGSDQSSANWAAMLPLPFTTVTC